MLTNEANYKKSNLVLKVDFNATENAKMYARVLLDASGEIERQKFSEALLDELCDSAGIDIINLKISAAKQWHKKYQNKIVSKQYGYYRPKENYIYIFNRTAIQGKPLAPKTFLDTLLHEWMHHYDFRKLGINSIHSAGFYQRLGHLKNILGI